MPYNITYLLYTLPGLALALLAKYFLSSYYNTYSKVPTQTGLTGLDAGKIIISNENLPISSEVIPGELTDHYDSQRNIVRFSSGNAASSIAGIAIVAHELGHACQDRDKFGMMSIRTALVPATNIGSNLGFFLIILGLALQFSGLATLGLILFSLTFIFTLVTLPVEFNASKRGIDMIKKYNLLTPDEIPGAKKVLMAAAFTYVAATVTSLGQVLYYVMMLSGKSKD
ncbi:zinc metallopeptidase [bacterium]|nr:MAG: zinc metallopeptidase [bacterium]